MGTEGAQPLHPAASTLLPSTSSPYASKAMAAPNTANLLPIAPKG